MKPFITIALIVINITLNAQCGLYNRSLKETRSNNLKTVLVFTSSIALNALGDAHNDMGNKTLGHSLNAASIGVLLMGPYIFDVNKNRKINWLYYLASYTTIRMGVFDPVYNVTRGLDINYVGTSSLSDKMITKLNSPDNLGVFSRTIFLTIGVSIPFNKL